LAHQILSEKCLWNLNSIEDKTKNDMQIRMPGDKKYRPALIVNTYSAGFVY
jgi:hypothetical protein